MSKLRRFSLDPGYDPMGDCHCYPSIEEDDNGMYVLYEDYMKLLREYSEAVTNEGTKTCANPLCDNRADMYLGKKAYCCNCLQPNMPRAGTDG
jgi:hypothetical protein